VDLSQYFLEKAKEVNPDEKFEMQNVLELKEANNSYDVVVCSHVIDHLYQGERAISELFRVANRFMVLSIMISDKDSRFNHDHDFINHEYSLAEVFGNTALGWKPFKTALFIPEWNPKALILQCAWKKQ
jgi:ubiquinone/menaquinone biosynthesis C-methylase UbiE